MTRCIDRAALDHVDGGVIARILIREIDYTFDDDDDVAALDEILRPWAERTDVAWMIVDLSRVVGIPSPFYGKLCDLRKLMRKRGAAIRLASPTSPVRHTLRITGLDQIFPIDRDVRAALDAVSGGRSESAGAAEPEARRSGLIG
jgi:anti-anti-sigma factor